MEKLYRLTQEQEEAAASILSIFGFGVAPKTETLIPEHSDILNVARQLIKEELPESLVLDVLSFLSIGYKVKVEKYVSGCTGMLKFRLQIINKEDYDFYKVGLVYINSFTQSEVVKPLNVSKPPDKFNGTDLS